MNVIWRQQWFLTEEAYFACLSPLKQPAWPDSISPLWDVYNKRCCSQQRSVSRAGSSQLSKSCADLRQPWTQSPGLLSSPCQICTLHVPDVWLHWGLSPFKVLNAQVCEGSVLWPLIHFEREEHLLAAAECMAAIQPLQGTARPLLMGGCGMSCSGWGNLRYTLKILFIRFIY